ncbi:hypothetical protein HHI36_008890 [Cryptolaemus montrouzieri]|uniref:Uncharacterized protein n=1 Tax=Cryptolaemus montrouzieri TaxID=559131 RepID=A0ABD2MUB7_9CUCU
MIITNVFQRRGQFKMADEGVAPDLVWLNIQLKRLSKDDLVSVMISKSCKLKNVANMSQDIFGKISDMLKIHFLGNVSENEVNVDKCKNVQQSVKISDQNLDSQLLQKMILQLEDRCKTLLSKIGTVSEVSGFESFNLPVQNNRNGAIASSQVKRSEKVERQFPSSLPIQF